jgi:uroporphyrinogen-III synthase
MSLLIVTKTTSPDSVFKENVKDAGFYVSHMPMLSVSYYDDFGLSFDPKVLIITSKHALHNIENYKNITTNIPVLCVGRSTAEMLYSKGFTNVVKIFDTSMSLKKHIISNSGEYNDALFLRGKHVTNDFSDLENNVRENVVYESNRTTSIDDKELNIFKDMDNVTIALFSSRGAIALANIIKNQGLGDMFKRTNLLCMSKRVLKSLDEFNWKHKYVCERPRHESFIKCLNLIKRNES